MSIKRKNPVKKAKKNQSANRLSKRFIVLSLLLVVILTVAGCLAYRANQSNDDIDSFRAQPLNVVHPLVRPSATVTGISPSKIKTTYNLSGSGSGTIAIVNAYDNNRIEGDLATFSTQFGIRSCTTANNCFEKHKMAVNITSSTDWSIETALDVEWAHAIAPNAKILLVEARSNSGTDLINAVDYARSRSDVVAVSMSWGGDEFSSETSYESHFTSSYGATFFAASGDNGHGTSWPAVSAGVVGVGGTTVRYSSTGSFASETAWSGSGGGVSAYISKPSHQTTYGISSLKRASPDVAYNADPASGFPVYSSVSYAGKTGWFQVGGTSAGSPQWAALRSISNNVKLSRLYQDAKTRPALFRDIVSGRNGSCGAQCNAVTGYDFVTGLGSPLSTAF